MKEKKFIEQNRAKWEEFEKLDKSNTKKDPDKISNLFVEINDDLSYAFTFYENRSVRYYLNNLAQKIYFNIYKNNRINLGKFIQFWRSDLPDLIYHSRKEFILSFIIFAISVLIGVFSQAQDPDFARNILGDSYVNKTLQNIEKGDPMAVYKDDDALSMFFGITINNIKVAFFVFVLGILFVVGSIIILIQNGITLGTFQFLFYQQGAFKESLLTVWQHGTIEISSIIIAGAAGIVLGKGLVFPKTYTRMQSFQISAKKGIQILLGTVPLFIIAGFIESFSTRHTDLPDILRIISILISLLFVVGYFVIYPFMRHRVGLVKPIKQPKFPVHKKYSFNEKEVLGINDLFKSTFIFYKYNILKITKVTFLLTLLSTCIIYIFNDKFNTLGNWNYGDWTTFFYYNNNYIMFIINVIIMSILITYIYFLMIKGEKSYYFLSKNIIKILPLIALINSMLFSSKLIVISVLLFPFIVLAVFISIKEKTNPIEGLVKSFSLISSSFMYIMKLFFIVLLMSVMCFLLFYSPITFFYIDIIKINIITDFETFRIIMIYLIAFLSMFVVFMILPIFFISIGYSYFSLLEIKTAGYLHKSINTTFKIE